jgi:IS30 family transposase
MSRVTTVTRAKTMKPKIPPELEEVVLQKSAGGTSSRQISAWLKQEHGVTVSYRAVVRLVARDAPERATSVKAAVRSKLATSITTDVDRSGRLLKRALIIAKRHQDDDDPGPWTRVARTATDLMSLRAKLAGLEQPDEQRATAIVVLPAEESD